MSKSYLAVGAEGITEEAAIIESTGSGDANKIISTDAAGKLNESFLPTGIGADTKIIVASEALSAGDLVNIWNDAGTGKARKADASGGVAKKADGFVLSAVLSGANATVYFEGTITGLSGLTPGAVYRLSATQAGKADVAIPTTAGHIFQNAGKAISATEITFEPSDPIIRG